MKVPIAEITKADVKGGALTIAWKGGQARLDLGAAAGKWAEKIRNPRGLLDKLGIKPESRVALVGLDEPGFLGQVRARAAQVAVGKPVKGTDLVLVSMKAKADLQRLVALRRAIEPDGAIWVIWPKGVKTFREDDVRAAGPSAGPGGREGGELLGDALRPEDDDPGGGAAPVAADSIHPHAT